MNVNGISHCIQVNVSESGLQTGATFPSCVIGRLILAQSGGPTYDGGDGSVGTLSAALSMTCSSTNSRSDDTASGHGSAT